MESWKTRLLRWKFNLHPAYRGTGGRVTYIERDLREVRVRIPLGWRTRNYVGTIFGGSMYGAVDPIYMVMLMERLGPGYVVWDKAATIRFRKPGRSVLHGVFRIGDEEIASIRKVLEIEPSLDRSYTVELVDAEGAVHAVVEKVIYVRRRTVDSRPSRTPSRGLAGSSGT
jgi:hypothetical protein